MTMSSGSGSGSSSDITGTLTWQGRQLDSFDISATEYLDFEYDADGLRTKKIYTINDVTAETEYIWSNGQLTALNASNFLGTVGTSAKLLFIYDENNEVTGYHYEVVGVDQDKYTGTMWYEKNLQGDVTAIVSPLYGELVTYEYDAWGNITYDLGWGTTGISSVVMAMLMITLNPMTYRGYQYDIETGLYYLQSRYYSPTWGRFLNADESNILYLTQGDVLGANLFSYCNNNSTNYIDHSGSIHVWMLYGIAGAALFGGVTYLIGRLLGMAGKRLAILTTALAAIGALAAAMLGVKFLAKISPKLAQWFQKVAKGTKFLKPQSGYDGKPLSFGGIVVLDAFKLMFHPPNRKHNFFHVQIEIKVPGIGKRWLPIGRIKIEPKSWFK